MKVAIAVFTLLIPICQGLECNFGGFGQTRVCEPGEQCKRILKKDGNELTGFSEGCSDAYMQKCATSSECRLYFGEDDQAICCCNTYLCNNEHYEPVDAWLLLGNPPAPPPLTLGPPPPGGGLKCYSGDEYSGEMEWCKYAAQKRCYRVVKRKFRGDGLEGFMRGCQGYEEMCPSATSGKACKLDPDDSDFAFCCCDTDLCNDESFKPSEVENMLSTRLPYNAASKSTTANFWLIPTLTAVITHWVVGQLMNTG